MFWREHSYVAFSTTYVGYLTLRRKSAYLHRKKISCCRAGASIPTFLQGYALWVLHCEEILRNKDHSFNTGISTVSTWDIPRAVDKV